MSQHKPEPTKSKSPAPKGKVGKVTYFVKVAAPVSFPVLEFARKKDAEVYKRALKRSKTLIGFKVKADILKQEVTDDGFHL